MAKRDVCSVTIVFANELGGPRVSAADAVSWVEGLLTEVPVDGYNSLRYSEGRVSAVQIKEPD